jgi:hypothetical protein
MTALKPSVAYVSGRALATYGRGIGIDSIGKKTPPRNIIGNLSKFESIIASLGSDANPEIIVPIPVKEKLASTMTRRTKPKLGNETPKSK